MLLIIVPTVGLLIFEATRIARSPSLNIEIPINKADRSSPTFRKEPPANLNRLDPTTHVVAGVRERKSLSSLFQYISRIINVPFRSF